MIFFGIAVWLLWLVYIYSILVLPHKEHHRNNELRTSRKRLTLTYCFSFSSAISLCYKTLVFILNSARKPNSGLVLPKNIIEKNILTVHCKGRAASKYNTVMHWLSIAYRPPSLKNNPSTGYKIHFCWKNTFYHVKQNCFWIQLANFSPFSVFL